MSGSDVICAVYGKMARSCLSTEPVVLKRINISDFLKLTMTHAFKVMNSVG
jgi:hypothetical protein